jgi:hypothetical protein
LRGVKQSARIPLSLQVWARETYRVPVEKPFVT